MTLGIVSVEIKFYGAARSAAGTPEAALALPQGFTARDLLRHLGDTFGASLSGLLLTCHGEIRPHVKLYAQDREIKNADLDAAVASAEPFAKVVVFVIPATGGGD